MGGSCLQQRADGYPAYVFHEPTLHSLSQSYSHAAHQSAAAHSQPHRGIPGAGGHGPGTPTTPSGQPAGPGAPSYQPTTSTATGKSAPTLLSFFVLLRRVLVVDFQGFGITKDKVDDKSQDDMSRIISRIILCRTDW